MTDPSPSRPPIGIEPEYIWKTKRLHELVLATARYIDAGWDVNFGWCLEMHKLIGDMNVHQQQQRRMTTDDYQKLQKKENN